MSRIDELVGGILANRRQARGLSQAQLGHAIGLSRTSVTNIESGKQPLSVEHLYAAAGALGVSPRDLLPAVDLPIETPPARRDPVAEDLLKLLKPTCQEDVL